MKEDNFVFRDESGFVPNNSAFKNNSKKKVHQEKLPELTLKFTHRNTTTWTYSFYK